MATLKGKAVEKMGML